jgi:acyl-CoA thioester hydrolase
MIEPSSTTSPETGSLDGPVHHLPVRVYYEDTDFTGFVYHANYLRFFERGRSEMLRCMAAAAGGGAPAMGTFAVVRIEIDYRLAARIHDALIIRTAFEGMRGPRLIFRQSANRGLDLLCEAMVVAVPLSPDGRARRPTAAEMQHWNAFRQDEAPQR